MGEAQPLTSAVVEASAPVPEFLGLVEAVAALASTVARSDEVEGAADSVWPLA
jgi:hypothetical protein